MTAILNTRFEEAFKSYYTDKIFISLLKKNKGKFLDSSNLTTLKNLPFVVPCLLLGQSMQDLLDGYSGCSMGWSYQYFNEAVGIAAFYDVGSKPLNSNVRYDSLVVMIMDLMQANEGFADIVDDLISER